MEVKAGYKQTEVGVIPEDWEIKPLGRLISSVEYGSSAKSEIQGQMPVLRMGNLHDGKIDWQDLVFTNNEFEISKYQLHSGDVLFNRTNTIDLVGKTSIYNGERPAIFAGYLIRIKVDKSLLNPQFLNYILNTEFSRKYSGKVLSVAVGQANINAQKLKTYPIPLPPTKAEQDAIAEALSDADTLIEALEQLLAKKRQVKQGAMQELLRGKRRLPGFSGEWEIRKLGEITEIVSGGTPSTRIDEYWNGNVNWCIPTDITSTPGKYLDSTEKRITELGLKNSSATLLPKGTLLLCSRATIGDVKIATATISTNQGFKSLICSDQVYNEFLYYLLLTMKPILIEKAIGSTFLEITKKETSLLEIKLPPVPEQTAIAEILSDMDAEIAALEGKLSKAREVKAGMMSVLLTGRIRLNHD